MPNVVEITIRANDLSKPVMDKAEADARASGERSGQNFSRGVGDQAKNNLSPLLASVFAGAATLGPAALVAGVAGAVGTIGVLLAKSNADVKAGFTGLGQDVESTLTQAVAPLAGDIQKAIGTLDQGLRTVGPELSRVFSAAAPFADDIAKSMVSLVSGVLPGLAAGLRSAAPLMAELADFTGKIGQGLGGFIQQLGSGSGGAATGLKAIGDALASILPDLGQVIGSLSNGLGPALRDILNAAAPVADALAAFVSVIPPQAIEAAAVATTALFAAFKLGTLTGVVSEGTSFLTFLGLSKTAEASAVVETDALAASERGLGLAMDTALGPLGLLAAGVGLLSSGISFGNGKMQDMIGKLKAAVDAQKQQKQSTDDAAAAQAKATAATQAANTSLAAQQLLLVQQTVQTGNAAVTALSFAGSQNTLNGRLATTITDFTLASDASSAYKTALDALYGKYQSYSDAQAAFTTALADAGKQLTAGKDAFNLNTAAGAANEAVLSRLFTAGENRATALLKETGNQQLANQSLQQAVVALDNTARQAKFTQGQIDALNIALTGTKDIGSIYVPVNADVRPAIDAVGRAIRYIDNQVAYIQVSASGTSVGGRQLLAHGGVVGAAASGGVRGSLTLVGEQGPELVTLPWGSTVHSNPDTQRMMSAGAPSSGGGQVLELVIAGGDQELVTLLRKIIRVRGGSGANSVQKALGQSF